MSQVHLPVVGQRRDTHVSAELPRRAPDLARLRDEARALAAQIRPSLAPPEPRVRQARRVAASLGTAARGYVENRRRARAGREDFLPLYFIWTTHRACNFLCTYCDDHRGAKYPELPKEGTLDTAGGRRLLEVMRTRASSVYFAGGEPTLRKDLPELAAHARALDYHPIVINTNASAFDRLFKLPSWRTFLTDIDTIVVSLDGLDLEWLAQTWVTKRPEDVIRNLLLLRELADEYRVKLMVNCVIQPGQIAHARAVLDFARDIGVWFTPVPMNVAAQVSAGLLDDPEYRALAELILERKRQGQRITGSLRMNERLLFSAPLECRNTLKPHVDYDGALYWPCKASAAVEPVRVPVLAHDHVDALWADCTARIDPTGFASRCGGRCNWAQNYSTDAYAHGLTHPLSLLGEVAGFLGRA